MRQQVVDLLNNLNRQFYDDFAESFAASRGNTEPGLDHLLASVRPGDSVLDLGCGQGRIARLLPPGCAYTGVDFSGEMLAIAQQHTDDAGVQARFLIGDLLEPAWPVDDAGGFQWVILRAVLHHIPGAQHRQSVVSHAARLLVPEGQLIIANWQFLDIERLRRRLLPWERVGLTPGDVESGDYLLDWQRDGFGVRYVHLVDEDETRALAQEAGCQIASLFRADGHHNNLTLYAVLSAPQS